MEIDDVDVVYFIYGFKCLKCVVVVIGVSDDDFCFFIRE